MKKNNRIVQAAAIAALLSFAGSPARALTGKETAVITRSIKDAPVAELAVKAAEMVTKAAEKEKTATAVAAVRAAIIKNTAGAVSVVGSVVKAAPATAPEVAVAAARVVPDQIEAIATTAALAAPDLADKIVAALAELNPKAEERVAKAVMLAVPQAEAKIRKKPHRDREPGHPEANSGETFTSSNIRVDGSSFPAAPPVPVPYAGPGRDPGH